MLTSLASLNSFADAFVERALSVAWQWTALVVLFALPAHWLLRSHSPALRYWIWQIVLLKLLVMPFWVYAVPVAWLPPAPEPAPIVVPVPESAPSDPVRITIDSEPETRPPVPITTDDVEPVSFPIAPTPRVSWAVWLVLAWCAVVVLQALRIALQRFRLAQLLARGTPASAAIANAVEEASHNLGLASVPRALLTSENVSPFVCGTLRPTLVLPSMIASSLPPEQLRQVLLHELAHVRRRDLLWGWIPQIVRTLWFTHPVVHWAVYRLRLERELACDQLAMTLSGRTAADYAQTLVDVVTQTSTAPPLCKGGAGGSRSKGHASTHEPAHLKP